VSTTLGSWLLVGFIVLALVVAGAALLGRQPPRARAARLVFTAATLLLSARIGWSLAFEAQGVSAGARIVLALTILGVIGAWWSAAVSWSRRS
jgi:hypothetical protein